MSNLTNNTTQLEALLAKINALPAPGAELPELDNEGAAADLRQGKELIDGDGNKVVGTIETFDGSYECSGESTGGSGRIETCTVTINYNGADFGGLGGEVQSTIYCSTADNRQNIQSTVLQSGIDFVFTDELWWGSSANLVINNIVKNSMLVIIDTCPMYNESIQHNLELLSDPLKPSPRIFLITQDGTIQI